MRRAVHCDVFIYVFVTRPYVFRIFVTKCRKYWNEIGSGSGSGNGQPGTRFQNYGTVEALTHTHTSHGLWRPWRVALLFDDVINVALKHWRYSMFYLLGKQSKHRCNVNACVGYVTGSMTSCAKHFHVFTQCTETKQHVIHNWRETDVIVFVVSNCMYLMRKLLRVHYMYQFH